MSSMVSTATNNSDVLGHPEAPQGPPLQAPEADPGEETSAGPVPVTKPVTRAQNVPDNHKEETREITKTWGSAMERDQETIPIALQELCDLWFSLIQRAWPEALVVFGKHR